MAPLSLNDPVKIGSITAKNRICIPPMVIYHHVGPDGMAVDYNVDHYGEMARGGAGLIIQEATCISPEGRLCPDQLGIWSDDHIPGLRRITEAVHREGAPILVQLHHGGIMSVMGRRPCPSDYSTVNRRGETMQGQEMTPDEIEAVKAAFIAAGRRAWQAGYDGAELHGCHGYLLCQFLNRNVNRRTDRYADGLALVTEIMEGIRQATSPDFVIGIRLGGFEPALADGIEHAKALEAAGTAFLDISYGFFGEMDQTAPGNPDFSPPVRAAAAVKREVSIPVFAVEGVRTPSDARAILAETGVDMIDVGRSALVDPHWPEKALRGAEPGRCLDCKECQWRIDERRCAGRLLMK